MKNQFLIDKVIRFEEMQFKHYRNLANWLDIQFAEVIDIQPELHPLISQGKVFGYRLLLGNNAPQEILNKIKGLNPEGALEIPSFVVIN